MNKEEEILQRLEQLRVEQLKTLRELKKVEKAKKKQRRLTAHGYPVITESRTKNNDSTSEKHVATPVYSKEHVLCTSSKTCSNFDTRKVKTTFTPYLYKLQDEHAEKASNSTLSTNENASSINNAAQRKKTVLKQLKPRLAEAHKQEESSSTYKTVAKPYVPLDLTPNTSLLSHKKEENSLARVVKRKGVKRLVASPRFSKKLRSSLGFPGVSKRLQKSDACSPIWNFISNEQVCSPKVTKPDDITRIAIEKIAKGHGVSSGGHQIETNISAKEAESERQDFGHDIMSKDMLQSQINKSKDDSEKQIRSRQDTSLVEGGKNEKLHPSKPAVSSPKEEFSQSIFSQSLFDDFSAGDSILCEEETLKKPGKQDVLHCYQPLSDRNGSNRADAYNSEVNSEQRLNWNAGIERNINLEKSNERSKGMTSEYAATNTLPSNAFQLEKEEVCVDPSVPCKDAVLNKVGKNDSPYCCELFANWNGKENRKKDKNKNNITGHACNVEKETRINVLDRKVVMDNFENNLTSSLHLDNAAYKNISCKTDSPPHTLPSIALKLEKEGKEVLSKLEVSRKTNFLGVMTSHLSSVILPEMSMEDNVNETKETTLSTATKEDVIIQPEKADMSEVSSLRKMFEAGLGRIKARNNQASLIQKFDSRYEFEDIGERFVMEESSCLQSRDNFIADDESVVSGHKNLERKGKSLRLPSETGVEMSTDVPDCIEVSDKPMVFDDRSLFKSEFGAKAEENKVNQEANTVSQELYQLRLIEDEIVDDNFDELFLSEPFVASLGAPPFPQNVPDEENFKERSASTSIVREICLQHSTDSSPNEVRAIKFLSYHVGDTSLDVIAVCLPRLLVLWKALNRCSWVVLHKWMLSEDEEVLDLEVTSAGQSIVLVIGGKFAESLGRIYCVYDKGDCKFDICDELSFSGLGETTQVYKNICLLPSTESTENTHIILASAYGVKIALRKWTIDLMCLSLEDYKDLGGAFGKELSTLSVVQGSKCLLLGCVDSYIYLWNFNSCELLCKMNLDLSLFTTPICLHAETSMGIIFLSLLYKEENKVCLVAINPQTSREACLKTLNMAHAIGEQRNKVVHCYMAGPNVISSFKQGHILVWNVATDCKTVLDQKYGDEEKVCSISVHPEDSLIAFGTISGCVNLNVMQ